MAEAAAAGGRLRPLAARMLRRYYSLLAVFLLWEIIGRSGFVSDIFMPPFTQVLGKWYELSLYGNLLWHVTASMQRAILGFSSAVLIGIPLGLCMGWFRRVGDFFDPIVSIIYPIPKVGFVPLLMVWFGIGEESKVAVIFLATVFPLIINTHAGVQGVSKQMVWAVLSMGATKGEVLRRVVLPHVLPQIFAGLRISMALTWALLFVAEMVASSSGLGFLILFRQRMLRTDEVFVGILTIALFGYTFDRLVGLAGRRLCHWYYSMGTQV